MIFSLKVSISPEWAEIHRNFASLIRLSNIATPLSKFINVQGDLDEVGLHNSSCHSPVHDPESLKLFELLAPVKIEFPPEPTTEELSNFHALVTNLEIQQKDEKEYIGLIFQEYCKRKSIMQKREKEFDVFIEEIAELQRRDLPPSIRQGLVMIEQEETSTRDELLAVYDRFLKWIEEVQPQWLEAVNRLVEENRIKEEAKKAALEASKALLVQELTAGKKLSSMSNNPVGESGNNVDSSYVPNVALDDATHEEPSPAELRHKAIELLEQQEAVIRHRREQQLLELKLKEESIRKHIKDKENERLAEEEKKRRENWEQLHKSLLEQEGILQERLRAREEERRQKEEERHMLLEHCAAEEEIIRRRLKDQEARHKAVEDEKKRLEAQKKKDLYEHILAEEELLRQRIQQREAEKEIEKQQQAAAAEEERRKKAEKLEEEIRLREQHNSLVMEQEALHRSKEEHNKAERLKQVALLKQQEEVVRARLRTKEIVEIQAKEQKLQSQPQQPVIYPSTGFFLSNSQAVPSPSGAATVPYVPATHPLTMTSAVLRDVGGAPVVSPGIHVSAYQLPSVAHGGVVIHPMQAYPPFQTGHTPNGIQPMISSNPAVTYPKVNLWSSTGVPYSQSSPPSTTPMGEYGYLVPPPAHLITPQDQGGSWQQQFNVFEHR
ncbi:unnamed protein product [Phytomonas sp. EM1]|nr:unnamed protein product [Phytomonas sp. EM1]|eukprot:CCW60948.1 unnamed protein product [Phytomonas sp. isolate EM1]